jgi:hypothetical protein
MFIRAPESDTHKLIGRLPGFEEDRPAPGRTVAACLDAVSRPTKTNHDETVCESQRACIR